MTGPTAILFALLGGFSLLAFLYPRRRIRSLTYLRGPQSSSFWLGIFASIRRQVDIYISSGNEVDIQYQNEIGDCEFKWMREYGSAWRRAGCFGVSTRHSATVFQFNETTDGSLNGGGPKSH
jgi:hypothetical protein